MLKLVLIQFNLSESDIPSSKFMLHELYCVRNVKKCHCGMIINIDDEEEHHKEYHVEIKCPHCSKKFPKPEIAGHVGNCDYIQTECRYCTLGVAKRDLEEHEYICGAKTEQCHICHKYVPIKDMDKHVSNNCDGEDHYLNRHIDVNKLEVVNKTKKVNKNRIQEEVKRMDTGSSLGTVSKPVATATMEKVGSIKVDLPKNRHIIEKPKESNIVVDKFNRYGSSKVEQDKAKQNLNNMIKANAKSSNTNTPTVDTSKINVPGSNHTNKIELNKHRIDLSHKHEPSNEDKIKRDIRNFEAKVSKPGGNIIQPPNKKSNLEVGILGGSRLRDNRIDVKPKIIDTKPKIDVDGKKPKLDKRADKENNK
jgi:hypothetical protein